MPVGVAPFILMRRLLIVVVPATVTASTRFLIQLKLVPVAVGIGTGVVPAKLSSRENFAPVSALAHVGLAPTAICACVVATPIGQDRKSTRLNSSHQIISYAVFCLKKTITDNLYPFINYNQ